MTVVGAVYLPTSPPQGLRDAVRAAEEAALDELWLWEDCFFGGGIAAATAALSWTERLRVGVGLLPVPLRNVAATAMEMATLHRLFPQRAELAVGHGVQDWMAQVGARVESPMTLLREHLTALRSLLHGERVSVSGRYVQLDDVALDWPPTHPPTLIAGATGPRSLRLSGELADATILTASTTPEGTRRARQLIDEGRAAAGRTDPHEVIVYLLASTKSELVEQETYVGVAGDAAAIADAVAQYAEAGADAVVLQPAVADPDPVGFIRFAAEEVAPRCKR